MPRNRQRAVTAASIPKSSVPALRDEEGTRACRDPARTGRRIPGPRRSAARPGAPAPETDRLLGPFLGARGRPQTALRRRREAGARHPRTAADPCVDRRTRPAHGSPNLPAVRGEPRSHQPARRRRRHGRSHRAPSLVARPPTDPRRADPQRSSDVARARAVPTRTRAAVPSFRSRGRLGHDGPRPHHDLPGGATVGPDPPDPRAGSRTTGFSLPIVRPSSPR